MVKPKTGEVPPNLPPIPCRVMPFGSERLSTHGPELSGACVGFLEYARCTPLSCQPSRTRKRRPAAPAESPVAPLAVNFTGFYDAAIHDADDSDIAAARLAGISDLDLVGRRSFAEFI